MCNSLRRSDNYLWIFSTSKNWGIQKVFVDMFGYGFRSVTHVNVVNFEAITQLLMEILNLQDFGD